MYLYFSKLMNTPPPYISLTCFHGFYIMNVPTPSPPQPTTSPHLLTSFVLSRISLCECSYSYPPLLPAPPPLLLSNSPLLPIVTPSPASTPHLLTSSIFSKLSHCKCSLPFILPTVPYSPPHPPSHFPTAPYSSPRPHPPSFFLTAPYSCPFLIYLHPLCFPRFPPYYCSLSSSPRRNHPHLHWRPG